ncbi:MAG: phosphatidylserine decarboxylase [Lentisphaeria bacterium]|nr:phosphatidylserine decarboxylase [Lentisphaeria bacterium]
METQEAPRFYDRATGQIRTEEVLGDKWLRLAYCSPIRGLLQWPLFSCGLFSQAMGWYLNRKASVSRIAPTVKQLGIDLNEAIVPQDGFSSFNDFFARELKPEARPLPANTNALLSPADCRITVYPELTAGLVVPVKGTPYGIGDLLGIQGNRYARRFDGGSLIVCRLCPADYHRYHFIDDGIQEDYWVLRGKYHSVNPIALTRGYKVFTENLRTVRILRFKRGALAAMFAVGAFGVASIHDYADEKEMEFFRGNQAGFFTFGGSTVIMAFEPGKIKFDQDILEHSVQGIETLVKANSSIGEWL